MKGHSEKFQPLLVLSSESEVSASAVVDILQFPEVLSDEESQTANNLQQFLLSADTLHLEKFLIFTTGSTRLPNYGLGKIKVKFNNATSFFASTCLFSITLPNQLTDQQCFAASLEAVLESSKLSPLHRRVFRLQAHLRYAIIVTVNGTKLRKKTFHVNCNC